LLVVIFGAVALVIDAGLIAMAKGELQRTADAAALAGALHLAPSALPGTPVKLPISLPLFKPEFPTQQTGPAVKDAQLLASLNPVQGRASFTLPANDIQFVYCNPRVNVSVPGILGTQPLLNGLGLLPDSTAFYNGVQVTTRLDQDQNGALQLFFAPIFGITTANVQATSVAAIQSGYAIRPGAQMLPLAMDVTVWNVLRFGNGAVNAVNLFGEPVDLNGNVIALVDSVTWNSETRTLTPGPDQIWEVTLFPDQLTQLSSVLGPLSSVERVPGNLLTLGVGVNLNAISSVQLGRQIQDGPTSGDYSMAGIGMTNGALQLPFSAQGMFTLPTANEADLQAIIGQPRIMPLYATLPAVVGKVLDLIDVPMSYEFVGWGAVVITEVNLDGPLLRYIKVQPAAYLSDSVARTPPLPGVLSDGVYAGPFLVR
jgi:hypothetical protein